MARERKCRRICFQPDNRVFMPSEPCSDNVTLSFEECEAIRLSDHEGMDQAQASTRMDVSRGTFQRILYSARYKISDALIYGKGIIIGGGDYEIADTCCDCMRRCLRCRFDENNKDNKIINEEYKGEH